MGRLIDLSGQRFGRLKVIERVKSHKAQAQWRCICDCGKETVVCGQSLRTGHTQSCGCYGLEVSVSHTPSNKKHNESRTPLYRIWIGMRSRCGNEKSNAFRYYGGRGITVCEEWQNSFETFRDWALSNGYRDDLTIDRINVNGGYCPENCRWATMKTQLNNTRVNKRITWNGEEKTVAQWAEETGIADSTIRARMRRGNAAETLLRIPDKGGIQIGNQEKGTGICHG